MEIAIIGLLLLVVGGLAVVVAMLVRRRPVAPPVDAAQVSQQVAAQVGQLSLQALQQTQETFLQTAESRFQALRQAGAGDLEQKKELIDQQLGEIRGSLERVTTLVNNLEKDREQKFGQLDTQLKQVAQQTANLTDVTGKLRETLANTRARGQWGERMAEDVLRLMGFIEGVNYQKQQTLADNRARPDYTFLLPNGFKLNMDVKFPLENYLKLMEAATAPEQEERRRAFLRDVRQRCKEVVGRDYINPQQQTVDCVLVFIPNEQIFQFVQEHDRALLDEALHDKVVLCSPMTLFAILVVIRQALDSFTIQQTSNEVLVQLGVFQREWDKFVQQLDTVGRRIEAAQRDYQGLVTTRRNTLERPLRHIEDLRQQRGLALPAEAEAHQPALPGDAQRE